MHLCIAQNLARWVFGIALSYWVVGAASADNINDPSGIISPELPNIVGGNTAADGEFPFLVRLYINIGNSSYLCSGSLLSPTWVITAAHCLDGAAASGVLIRAGSNQKSSGGEIVGARQLYMHPSYNRGTFDNDIALINLSAAVTAPKTGSISRLSNNESSAMPEGSAVWVAGWGTTASGGNTSENLLKVSVNVSYAESCAANSSYFSYELTNNMICAGVPTGGKDACQGDSGGPLFRYDNNNIWLAGIVSWGYGCALSSYPGVYARVANYDAWINQTMSAAGGDTGDGGGSSGDGNGSGGSCVLDASSARTGTQIRINLNSGCSPNAANTFNAAATYWADFLYSPVTIEVDAEFAPLTCTDSSAVLGSAGPTAFATSPAHPEPQAFYAIAHSNALRGSDGYPQGAEITMSFNSKIGSPGCVPNYAWYFDDGTSATTPAGTIDLYGTALHEIAHGLGFLSLLGQDGSQAVEGYSDVFTNRLYSETLGALVDLSDAQRQSALISETDLTWSGSAVDGLTSTLLQGVTNDNVRMFAPNPYQSGSSVSHFDTSLIPNDLMEPIKTSRASTDYKMTRNLFRDIGWQTLPDAPAIASTQAGSSHIDVTVTAPYHLGNSLLLNYTATCSSVSTPSSSASTTGVGPTLRISGLTPETAYNCSATATTAVGESDRTPVIQTTTTPALPPGQATITSVDTYADEATFEIVIATSDTASGTADLYRVECTAPDGTMVAGTSATSSVTVSGLQEGVAYSCEASAENVVGKGGSTTVGNVVVDGTLPGLPVWLLYRATQSP